MKIRIKFAKSGVMKFIGHLDMMRYFQKAIRRAGVNICYSEGFSPHMIMSFAAPLGVGITSDGEYFDIEVKDTMTTADALQALNSTMVQGVEVTGYVQLPEDAKNAMSIVAAADYTLGYKDGYHSPFTKSQWKEALEKSFHSKETFMVTKKTKKNQVEVDLKPAVYTLEMVGTEENPAFHIFVSAEALGTSNRSLYWKVFIAAFHQKKAQSFPMILMPLQFTEMMYLLPARRKEPLFLF